MGGFVSKPPPPAYMLAPPPAAPKSSSFMTIVGALAAIGLLITIIYIGSYWSWGSGSTAAAPSDIQIDGKTGSTIPAANAPLQGTDSGLQFWMYIKDWDYKYGSAKPIIKRVDPTHPGTVCPAISLHPTDNTLDVAVSVYPSGSNLDTTDTGNGETFVCSVENVPIQSWFSVSVTIFQRNLDVYINGLLVKSCVLPGIPKPAIGDIIVGANGGFSGSVCSIHSSPTALSPANAATFYAAGTSCSTSTPASSTSGLSNLSLFGYTFVFGVKDSAGKQVGGISSSDISGWFSSSKKQ